MSDPIQQIIQTHPEFEQMQARYEVEIGEVRRQVEEITEDRDIWQEKAEGADDSVFEERKFLEKVITKYNPETKRDEVRKITISALQDALADRKRPRWNGEYGVLDSLEEVLNNLIPERVEVREVERVVEKEVLPANLTINGKSYKS